MYRRFISLLLVVALTMGIGPGVLAESEISGSEVILGVTTTTTETEDSTESDSDEVIDSEITDDEEETDEEDEDIYAEVEDVSITDYPTLQLGDADEEDGVAYIVVLQNRLIELGFLQSSADGIYGEDTETAVEQFQKLNGLEETGIADAATQTLLYSDESELVLPDEENTIVYGSETVRIQTALAEWGFLTGSVDGVSGTKTEEAITLFKTYVHDYVPATATPTPEPTVTPEPTPTPSADEQPEVVDVLLETPTPEPTEYVADSTVDETLLAYVNGEVEFDVYRETVQTGDESIEVTRVQTRLKQLGYLYASPDGIFGSMTALALKYFQYKHGLDETGIADEETQRILFSSDAESSEEYVFPYKLYVDISDQRVYVMGWDGSSYSIKEASFVCSTGKDGTPTPTGTYQAYGQIDGEWHYFKTYNCYAKWAYGIVGGILFHSVIYSSSKKLNNSSVRNLGKKASHGCVRLSVEDAKWIYDNCPTGTTVVIQD